MKPLIYNDTDLLTLVGSGSYETIDAFIKEARMQGCSRRLPSRLDWIKLGDTRVYLMHRDDRLGKAYNVLFGYYTINSVHVIYDDLTIYDKKHKRKRELDYRTNRPILLPGVRPPKDVDEFTKYVTTKKIVIVHREEVKTDPVDEWLEELWKEWLKNILKHVIKGDGNRYIPLSAEADNLERECGGASSFGSGRYPGTYASDELGDWILDNILDWLLDQPKLPDEYFWEEEIIVVKGKKKVQRVRKKHKRVTPGFSRSERMSRELIEELYGEPPTDLSGLVVFDKPYPLYFHPPRADFKGFQRIDGNSLLLKVELLQYLKK